MRQQEPDFKKYFDDKDGGHTSKEFIKDYIYGILYLYKKRWFLVVVFFILFYLYSVG